MRFSLILVFLLGFTFMLQAQEKVKVREDYAVTQLMKRFEEVNRMRTFVDGYRIQILATTDRIRMENARTQFVSKYPEIPIDFIHARPYYKLRAGAFATKLDAIRLLNRLKPDYPSAYPTKTQIKVEELVN